MSKTLDRALIFVVILCCGCPGWWFLHWPPETSEPDSGPTGAAGSGSPDAKEPTLPHARNACPKLETGNVDLLGISVKLWVGEQQAGRKGPLVLYWHGTGSFAGEAELMLGDTLTSILEQGGVVASPTISTNEGTINGVEWTTGDYELADEIVACAVEQLEIDPHRIYAAGCSGGGLQAGALVYGRSNYLAASMTNSGGVVNHGAPQNPLHVPAVITTHGSGDVDVVIISFADSSLALDRDVAQRGGVAVDCPHTGGHCGAPPEIKAAQWEFLQAHPYGVSPSPYAAGLPSDFPSECQIIEP